MDSIKVDVDGLIALSGVCRREVDRLGGEHRRGQESTSFQATASAVQQVSAAAGRVESLLTVRLQVTGHKFATAAESLAGREATSRREICAVEESAVT